MSEVQSAPKLQPALLAGLFIGVVSTLPFVSVVNTCCCLWVITGGMLAAYVMQLDHPLPITTGDGATVGLLAGLFGAIFEIVLAFVFQSFLGDYTAIFSRGVGGSRQDMPPEMQRLLREIGPQGLLVLGSLLFTVLSLFFGTIGGIVGAVFFRKPAPPAPPPPPPAAPWTPATFEERPWSPPAPPVPPVPTADTASDTTSEAPPPPPPGAPPDDKQQ